MNEDIKRILDTLKEHYDGLGWPYYPEDVLNPEDPKIIYNYIIQLQNNWNELKKFDEEKLKQYQKQLAQASTDLEDKINYTRCYCYRENLDKMQELEQGKDDIKVKDGKGKL